MSIIKEFKKFAMRGNVVDMAVGIIIGGAFGKIVSSIVNDVIMPPIGVLLGGVDFKDLSLTIKQATASQPAVTLNYGAFINTVLNFIIVAFAIFMMIKVINKLNRKHEETPPAPPAAPGPTKEEKLLAEIRDILKKKGD